MESPHVTYIMVNNKTAYNVWVVNTEFTVVYVAPPIISVPFEGNILKEPRPRIRDRRTCPQQRGG
jgi:hypothetical protein